MSKIEELEKVLKDFIEDMEKLLKEFKEQAVCEACYKLASSYQLTLEIGKKLIEEIKGERN